MERSSVVPVSNCVNTIIFNTILEAEQVLLNLPVESTKTDYGKAGKTDEQPNVEVARKTVPIPSTVCCKDRNPQPNESFACAPKGKAEIVPGSVKVCPLTEMVGVVIDLSVSVQTSSGRQVLELRLECPQFVPRRIRINGKWRDVV